MFNYFPYLCSIKALKNILLILAAIIVLFHNIMPHEHHSQMDDAEDSIEHKEANSLLDYLQLAFHFDTGVDHLENFKTASAVFLSIPLETIALFSSTCSIPVTIDETRLSFNTFLTWHSPGDLFVKHTSFRGPPRA